MLKNNVEEYYVALRGGSAAGYATRAMYGGVPCITTQPDIMHPRIYRADTIEGLMLELGGHYAGYKPYKVTRRTIIEMDGEPVKWADARKVWGD